MHGTTELILVVVKTCAIIFERFFLKEVVGGPRVETLPPPGGNFRPLLHRSISYLNPKLTCYAKIQCRLQELWLFESHSVKKKILEFFLLVIGIT